MVQHIAVNLPLLKYQLLMASWFTVNFSLCNNMQVHSKDLQLHSIQYSQCDPSIALLRCFLHQILLRPLNPNCSRKTYLSIYSCFSSIVERKSCIKSILRAFFLSKYSRGSSQSSNHTLCFPFSVLARKFPSHQIHDPCFLLSDTCAANFLVIILPFTLSLSLDTCANYSLHILKLQLTQQLIRHELIRQLFTTWIDSTIL